MKKSNKVGLKYFKEFLKLKDKYKDESIILPNSSHHYSSVTIRLNRSAEDVEALIKEYIETIDLYNEVEVVASHKGLETSFNLKDVEFGILRCEHSPKTENITFLSYWNTESGEKRYLEDNISHLYDRFVFYIKNGEEIINLFGIACISQPLGKVLLLREAKVAITYNYIYGGITIDEQYALKLIDKEVYDLTKGVCNSMNFYELSNSDEHKSQVEAIVKELKQVGKSPLDYRCVFNRDIMMSIKNFGVEEVFKPILDNINKANFRDKFFIADIILVKKEKYQSLMSMLNNTALGVGISKSSFSLIRHFQENIIGISLKYKNSKTLGTATSFLFTDSFVLNDQIDFTLSPIDFRNDEIDLRLFAEINDQVIESFRNSYPRVYDYYYNGVIEDAKKVMEELHNLIMAYTSSGLARGSVVTESQRQIIIMLIVLVRRLVKSLSGVEFSENSFTYSDIDNFTTSNLESKSIRTIYYIWRILFFCQIYDEYTPKDYHSRLSFFKRLYLYGIGNNPNEKDNKIDTLIIKWLGNEECYSEWLKHDEGFVVCDDKDAKALEPITITIKPTQQTQSIMNIPIMEANGKFQRFVKVETIYNIPVSLVGDYSKE